MLESRYNPAVRIYFTNLGCKLNQAEVEQMARRFQARGCTIAPALEEADVHIVNSCTVTHVAARDSRKTARRGHRLGLPLRTVLTGCYVSESPETAAAVAGVDLVVPNDQKDQIVERVFRAFAELVPQPVVANDHRATNDHPATSDRPYGDLPSRPQFGNARALVKIEDGCNMGCAFCIIPQTRGRQISRLPDEIVREVQQLSDQGFPEIVLTGVQISAYRAGTYRLWELVKKLLAETDVARLRLTSIAPWEFDLRLLGLLQTGRICRHFHLSLQSGSTATLRRMRRPYSSLQFAALVEQIRSRVPGVAITTDVIVGFPGESDEEFAESLEFVRSVGFARVHAFPYSTRPGTVAEHLSDAVDAGTKKHRMRQLLDVAESSRLDFYAEHLDATAEVLWEERRGDRWLGTTDHYIRVATSYPADLRRRLTPARLLTIEPHAVSAEITEVPNSRKPRSQDSIVTRRAMTESLH